MTLDNWRQAGWIKAHSVTADEVSAGLAVVDRDLRDASLTALSADRRLSIAQSAIMQIATVALAVEGYRVSTEAHHYRATQSLLYTIKIDRGLVNYLETIRKKRNKVNYVEVGVATDAEATELLAVAVDLRAKLMTWLRETRSDLAPNQ